MCLAIPSKVLQIENGKAELDVMGEKSVARLDPTNSVKPTVGDWVIVQFGMVTRVIDEKSARESLKEWESLAEL